MENIQGFIVYGLVFIGIFIIGALALREVVAWYSKMNEQNSLIRKGNTIKEKELLELEKQTELQEDQNEMLKKILKTNKP